MSWSFPPWQTMWLRVRSAPHPFLFMGAGPSASLGDAFPAPLRAICNPRELKSWGPKAKPSAASSLVSCPWKIFVLTKIISLLRTRAKSLEVAMAALQGDDCKDLERASPDPHPALTGCTPEAVANRA